MSEHQQETRNAVSMEEYMNSMPWRATAKDIGQERPAQDTDSPKERFILRLLDPDLTGAYDRLVELVAKDDLGSSEQRAKFLITVRPILEGVLGKAEAHPISSDGLIYDKADSPEENGYFVDAQGIDEDEFRNVDMVQIRKPQEETLRYLEAEPPSWEEQNRYYG